MMLIRHTPMPAGRQRSQGLPRYTSLKYTVLSLAAVCLAAHTTTAGAHSGQPTRVRPTLMAQSVPAVREITPEEVVELQSHKRHFFFIDVRRDYEWNEGRCKGATHIERNILEREIEKRIPNHKAIIVLYCASGYRSGLAASQIQKLGYSNVRSMAGGLRSWHEKAYPEER
jgi:rhodanese-related sulfurtransferase